MNVCTYYVYNYAHSLCIIIAFRNVETYISSLVHLGTTDLACIKLHTNLISVFTQWRPCTLLYIHVTTIIIHAGFSV